jgi:hypothetical protein
MSIPGSLLLYRTFPILSRIKTRIIDHHSVKIQVLYSNEFRILGHRASELSCQWRAEKEREELVGDLSRNGPATTEK